MIKREDILCLAQIFVDSDKTMEERLQLMRESFPHCSELVDNLEKTYQKKRK